LVTDCIVWCAIGGPAVEVLLDGELAVAHDQQARDVAVVAAPIRCTRSPSRARSRCSASGDDAGQSAFTATGVSVAGESWVASPHPGASHDSPTITSIPGRLALLLRA
jgi:hypothetical protein